MNTEQLQLVTYEQAKRLKELGFDRVNNPCYEEDSKMPDHYPVLTRKLEKRVLYPAPAVALALKWIRDEKGYDCMVYRSYADNTKYLGEVYKYDANDVEQAHINSIRIKQQNTYEAAESALLDELLTVLEGEKGR